MNQLKEKKAVLGYLFKRYQNAQEHFLSELKETTDLDDDSKISELSIFVRRAGITFIDVAFTAITKNDYEDFPDARKECIKIINETIPMILSAEKKQRANDEKVKDSEDGHTYVGEDGNTYIAISYDARMELILHQKIEKNQIKEIVAKTLAMKF